jgi:5-methylcytosine-specific restriction endonuclease McrA
MAKCKECGSEWHTRFICPQRPRTLLQIHKPMNKIGKVQKRTQAAVAKWKRTQEPNHQGYYECYICHKWTTYLEAEHVKSKVRHPELRTVATNLKPVCDQCNASKGSKDN